MLSWWSMSCVLRPTGRTSCKWQAKAERCSEEGAPAIQRFICARGCCLVGIIPRRFGFSCFFTSLSVPANQLSLVVYPTICQGLYIPCKCRFSSIHRCESVRNRVFPTSSRNQSTVHWCWVGFFYIRGGPMLVINGVITPMNGLIL